MLNYLQHAAKNMGLIELSEEEKRQQRERELQQVKQRRRERIMSYNFIFEMPINTIEEIQTIFDRIERIVPDGLTRPVRADTIFRHFEGFFLEDNNYNGVRLVRQLHLLYTLLKSYPGENDLLLPFVSKLISYQDDNCFENRRNEGTTLADAMCHFSKNYKVAPLYKSGEFDDNRINGSLVNGRPQVGSNSVNGTIYAQTFTSDPLRPESIRYHVITKVPEKHIAETLYEAFVNIVIINNYIERNPGVNLPLVPTFGIFMCPIYLDYDDCQICIDKNNGTYSQVNGNYLMITQKNMIGSITFADYLSKPYSTLGNVKKIFFKVINMLNMLQDGPYRLIHGDLHTSNILVSSDEDAAECWIIDWGMASFSIRGQRKRNWLEKRYDDTICTGAYDVFFLLE